MTAKGQLQSFTYDVKAGPLSLNRLDSRILHGNCRLAVQHFLHVYGGVKFSSEEILCPKSFKETGELVSRTSDGHLPMEKLKRGDVLFAERVLGKNGEQLKKSRENYPTENLWITDLHSAIYLGLESHLIWHATSITGSTCIWTLTEFSRYYRLVSARRFLGSRN